MFYGIILACAVANPTSCEFLNSRQLFDTVEACEYSFFEARSQLPQEVYLAGMSCMEVRYLDPES